MIAFSCAACGMKFSVKDEFAGRQTTCPTCRRPLVVPPSNSTVAFVAPERIDGQLSSLAGAASTPASPPGPAVPTVKSTRTAGRRYGCVQVGDLSPLKGMPFTVLHVNNCGQVRDLSPLDGMSLSEVGLPPEVDWGMDALRRMKALGKIHGMPAAEFWKKYDAGEFKRWKP